MRVSAGVRWPDFKFPQVSKIWIFLSVLFLAANCEDELEWVEKREGGILIERYQLKSDSILHGLYEIYYPSGELFERAHYKDGLLHGEKKFFFPDGQVQSIEHHENGEYHGTYMLFDSTGQVLQEATYERDKTVGLLKNYYPNGQVKEQVHFENGIESGPFKEYYPNGYLKAEGTYKDGDFEHGLLKLYDEQGVLKRKMNCETGVCRTIWRRDDQKAFEGE